MPVPEKEKIDGFIRSLSGENSPFCEALRERALAEGVPIIKKETENLLKVLLRVHPPKKVLEIGTGVAYSAIMMAEHIPPDAAILTVENYEKRIEAARVNIRASGRSDQITLLFREAGEAIASLKEAGERFDFIFLDGPKGQYIHWLEGLMAMMNRGGVLVSDNVLQEGRIALSRFAIDRRERTTHARMREFLRRLMQDERLVSSILPVGDGVAVSILKQE